MPGKRSQFLNDISRIKDGVLLMFDERDRAIARDWRKAMTAPAESRKAL